MIKSTHIFQLLLIFVAAVTIAVSGTPQEVDASDCPQKYPVVIHGDYVFQSTSGLRWCNDTGANEIAYNDIRGSEGGYSKASGNLGQFTLNTSCGNTHKYKYGKMVCLLDDGSSAKTISSGQQVTFKARHHWLNEIPYVPGHYEQRLITNRICTWGGACYDQSYWGNVWVPASGGTSEAVITDFGTPSQPDGSYKFNWKVSGPFSYLLTSNNSSSQSYAWTAPVIGGSYSASYVAKHNASSVTGTSNSIMCPAVTVQGSAINGTCKTPPHGTISSSTPTGVLCATGTTTTPIAEDADSFDWTCVGFNGGTSRSCSAPKSANGVCGAAHLGEYTSAPASNLLCGTGSASTVALDGSTYRWSCSGTGNGTPSQCYATDPKIACESEGKDYDENASIKCATPEERELWSCQGSGGQYCGVGANPSCAIPPASCQVATEPVISSFAASPSLINRGDACVLQWEVSGDDFTCRVMNTAHVGSSNATGEYTISSLQATTNYTLSCASDIDPAFESSKVATCKINPESYNEF